MNELELLRKMADDPALYCFKGEEVDAIQWAIEKLQMTAKILPFPEKPTEAQGWVCGCGGFNWILYANGDCLCLGCNCINTVIKVVRQDSAEQQSGDPK